MFGDDSKPDVREHSGKQGNSKKNITFMNNKLFVGNLSFNTTENDLQDAFTAHGTVREANLMVDRASGRPRGFAFVTMDSEQEAQTAMGALNGAMMDGRNLTVNVARPRESRMGGSDSRHFSSKRY